MNLTHARQRRRFTGELDHAALREACEYLDVSLPVRIRRANGTRKVGCHRLRLVRRGDELQPEHHITVSTYSSVAQANRTLLHELTHAAQAEREDDPAVFGTKYRRAKAMHGYADCPYEVEAREAAELLEDEFLIAK